MAYKWLVLDDFTGGRNATDDPLSLAENQVVQMRNMDTFRVSLARKKPGATAPAIGSAFTAKISSLIAHQPDNNPANAELWGVDDAATPIFGRMAGAATFASQTLTDNLTPATDAVRVRGTSYGGKLFLTYNSAVDRLHCYDPNLASPRVRRVGLGTPAAPTVADTGAGTYTATARYYRVRYRIKHGSIIDAQSEASASVAFTPSGSGTHARVTKPASISEQETHWVLEASADNVTFYEVPSAETAVGTTTFDDNTTVSNYSAGVLSPVAGAYTVPISFKYIIAAFNRILGMGSWESGGFQSSVYYTPAKGTSDKADDERIPNTTSVRNRLDLDEGTGGDGTGFAGPIYEAVYVFKYNQIRKISPTGGTSPVWDVIELSTTKGAIEQECIAVGEDANGRPCIYFMDSQVGPMIVGPVPPTEIGQGIRDLWDTVNLAATTKVGQVLDYPKSGQVWFWFATGANTEPNVLAKYTKASGAWSVDDTGGTLRLARAAVLFSRTPGAAMSRDRVPYTAFQSSNNVLHRADTTDLDDAGTTYQALVKTRPIHLPNFKPFRVTTPYIVAKAADGVTLTVIADKNFGQETQSATISLTLLAHEGSATRVVRMVEGIDLSGCTSLQLQIGDAAAIANSWQIERIYLPIDPEDGLP